MSTPKAMKDFIQRRKDNNLCLSCGKPLDRKGVNCIDCNNHCNYYIRFQIPYGTPVQKCSQHYFRNRKHQK